MIAVRFVNNTLFSFQFPNLHFPNVLQPLSSLPIFSSSFWQPWIGSTTPNPVTPPVSAPPPPQLAPPIREDGAAIAALVNAVTGLQAVVARLQSRQQILLAIVRCSNVNVNNCSRDFVSSQELKVPLEPGLGSDLSWLLDGLPSATASSVPAATNLPQNSQPVVPPSLEAVPNYLNSGLQNLGSYVLPQPQQPNVLPNLLNNGYQNVPNFLNQQGYPIRYPTNNFVNYPSFSAGINGNNKLPDNPNIFGLQGNLLTGNGIPGAANFLQGGSSLFPAGLPNSVSSVSGVPGTANFLQGGGSLFPAGLANSVSSSSSSSGDGTTFYTSSQQVTDDRSGKPTFTSISSTNDGTGTVIVSTSSDDGGKPHVTKLERDASVKTL